MPVPIRLEAASLEALAGGEILAAANADLEAAQTALVAHARQHRVDAVAELTLTVRLAYDAVSGLYSHKSSTKLKVPGRPAQVGLLRGGMDPAGHRRLFVEAGGLYEDPPPRTPAEADTQAPSAAHSRRQQAEDFLARPTDSA